MDDLEVRPVFLCTHCTAPTYSKSKCDNCGLPLFESSSSRRIEDDVEATHNEINKWDKLTE